jgi:hypothetical protein
VCLVFSAFTYSPVSLLEIADASVLLCNMYAYAQYISFISNLRARNDMVTDLLFMHYLITYLQIVYRSIYNLKASHCRHDCSSCLNKRFHIDLTFRLHTSHFLLVKEYEGVVVELHAFLTSTLDGGEPTFVLQPLCLATRAEGSCTSLSISGLVKPSTLRCTKVKSRTQAQVRIF